MYNETVETRNILHKRTVLLAKKPGEIDTNKNLSIFSFYLAKERYAIDSKYILTVFPLLDLTPLPGLPPYHLGITSWERKFVSVLKIEYFLHIPDRILSSLNRVILIQINQIRFCILTDRIDGLDWIEPSLISPMKMKETKTDKSLVQGVDDLGRILLKIEHLIEQVDFLEGNKCF